MVATKPRRVGGLHEHRSHQRGGRPSAPTAAIRAVLADAQPHPFPEISARACSLVTPESAVARHRRLNPRSSRRIWAQVEAGRQYRLSAALRRLERRGEVARRGGWFLPTRIYTLVGPPAAPR